MKRALVLAALALGPVLVRADCDPFPLYVGLNPNLNAGDALTEQNRNARYDQVKAAGANFAFYSPRWSELEPTPGNFDDNLFGLNVRRAADRGLPLLINFKVVDTVARTMPSDLIGLPFNNATVITRFQNMLNNFLPQISSYNAQVPWISLGNEVNIYLTVNSSETAAYQALATAGGARVAALTTSSASVTFTANALTSTDPALASLRDSVQVYIITYYPLESDYTVRPPSIVDVQFPQIVGFMTSTGTGKRLLFQEVGYPSGAANLSSEALQAEFYDKVFDHLAARPDVFLGANFMMLADLSDALAQAQGGFYGNTGNAFVSYLKTIGVVTETGAGKAAWRAFTARASGCAPAGRESIVAYPSPWRAAAHAGEPMRFDNLPDSGKLLILTPLGGRVAELPIDGGRASWDLRDEDGRAVPSGVYMAVEEGGASRGAFSVIR